MRCFSGRVESISQHAQSSASQFDGFSQNKPNNVFCTGRGGETTHILVVAESPGVVQIVIFYKQLIHVQA
jgi:phosphoenolpyruvate-protein kinase (PTS system EI component)